MLHGPIQIGGSMYLLNNVVACNGHKVQHGEHSNADSNLNNSHIKNRGLLVSALQIEMMLHMLNHQVEVLFGNIGKAEDRLLASK